MQKTGEIVLSDGKKAEECEAKHCLADADYRHAFDIAEEGTTITVCLKNIVKHTRSMKFLFDDSVFVMGVKDGILQIWGDEDA